MRSSNFKRSPTSFVKDVKNIWVTEQPTLSMGAYFSVGANFALKNCPLLLLISPALWNQGYYSRFFWGRWPHVLFSSWALFYPIILFLPTTLLTSDDRLLLAQGNIKAKRCVKSSHPNILYPEPILRRLLLQLHTTLECSTKVKSAMKYFYLKMHYVAYCGAVFSASLKVLGVGQWDNFVNF
jgi:hypothetical protein